ncbi:Aldo/keto reductase [Basidiobolus meristosporus CBS 931.73]|uniref:Aldo/keto reductase n=1 Tax=Basidiobolus meristosporus CBS 931.73 TaxID=1314790 RepID=A0A1Y1XV52_9FUNG|nr:Aldo/keto reductase [Basidiobolus meristosporus CBS 931.73]|eukprot:ORX89647.1 Aldo/keto reductase [Basidiobolus meristosporus CBS 931.73]
MGIGGAGYGSAGSDDERFEFLDKLYESGCTNWDTADIYGDSEDLLGKWFKRTGKRNEIFLATKFGITPSGINGKPEYVRLSVEKSLARLGVEQIDLYYLHRVDGSTPIETTMQALAELVREGKVKYIGLSEPSPKALRRAHQIHPISAIQVEYSPFALDIEQKGHLLDTARELGVAIVAYSPLGHGLLTGQVQTHDELAREDFRRTIPKFAKENFPKILELVQKLNEIGEMHQATPGQVTLAWLLAQGNDIIPIPGTKKIKYLEENLASLSVKLSDDDLSKIRRLAQIAGSEIVGTRYSAEMNQLLYVDSPELQ